MDDTLPSSLVRCRTDERTPVWFTTNHGLEDVVAQEFEARARAAGLAGVESRAKPDGRSSYAEGIADAPTDAVLTVAREMRSVHHVILPLYRFDLADDRPLEHLQDVIARLDVPPMENADTFRVSTVRRGDHPFTSVDVQRAAGAGLQDRYGTAVDLEDYDLDVRVDVRDRAVLVAIQETDDALSRRQKRLYQSPAALAPNVAYALLRLPHLPEPPRVVLDPFCGSGTILVEAAAHWPDARIYGSDRDEEVVGGAQLNLNAEGIADRVEVRTGDARDLRRTFPDVTPDLIVTNPPFGKRLGDRLDLHTFYRQVLTECHAALPADGWMVVLVLKPGAFSSALQSLRDDASVAFDVRHARRIDVGGLHPRIFVMQKP